MNFNANGQPGGDRFPHSSGGDLLSIFCLSAKSLPYGSLSFCTAMIIMGRMAREETREGGSHPGPASTLPWSWSTSKITTHKSQFGSFSCSAANHEGRANLIYSNHEGRGTCQAVCRWCSLAAGGSGSLGMGDWLCWAQGSGATLDLSWNGHSLGIPSGKAATGGPAFQQLPCQLLY